MNQDVFEPGAFYHIYNRGNNQENIFIEERNYSYFLKLVWKYIVPIANIYAFCLLRNHFHLLVQIREESRLPERYQAKPYLGFSHLFNSYTQSINKMYQRNGSLFQEHLKRKRIEDEKYLIQLIAYIHLNPVKHKFSDNFQTYPYSSFRTYLSDKPSILEKDYIFSLIDREEFEGWHDEKKLVTLEAAGLAIEG